jgi:hypothetical protein
VQQVAQAGTTTTLTSNVNPSVFGQLVTFTARVQPNPGGGNVSFTIDGGAPISFAMDATGRARMSISNLTVGNHTIVATYAGSANHLGSASTPLVQTVAKSNSRAIIATNGTPVPRNTVVTFTATVTAVAPGAGTPTGTVDFYAGATLIGTGTLSNGVTSITWTSATPGRFTISATYNGDAGFNLDPSNTFTQRFT